MTPPAISTPALWLTPGGILCAANETDGYVVEVATVLIGLTWRADRQIALLDAMEITEPCAIHAEPTGADSEYWVTTLELVDTVKPGAVHRRAAVRATDAFDALRRALTRDEGHPWHNPVAEESSERPSKYALRLLARASAAPIAAQGSV